MKRLPPSNTLKGRAVLVFNGERYAQHRGRWMRTSRPFVRLSRVVWEKHHGAIPAGHDIHHMNGNALDDRIENLTCLSRAEHARLHGVERNHLKGILTRLPMRKIVCRHCRTGFKSAHPNKCFCTKRCKEAYHHAEKKP